MIIEEEQSIAGGTEGNFFPINAFTFEQKEMVFGYFHVFVLRTLVNGDIVPMTLTVTI